MKTNKLPLRVVDVIMHHKSNDREEVVTLPITRYQNILCGPNIVSDSDVVPGAPFHLLKTSSEEMTVEEIRRLVGGIL